MAPALISQSGTTTRTGWLGSCRVTWLDPPQRRVGRNASALGNGHDGPPAVPLDPLESLDEVVESGLEASIWCSRSSSSRCARRAACRASMNDDVIVAVRMLRKAMAAASTRRPDDTDGLRRGDVAVADGREVWRMYQNALLISAYSGGSTVQIAPPTSGRGHRQ